MPDSMNPLDTITATEVISLFIPSALILAITDKGSFTNSLTEGGTYIAAAELTASVLVANKVEYYALCYNAPNYVANIAGALSSAAIYKTVRSTIHGSSGGMAPMNFYKDREVIIPIVLYETQAIISNAYDNVYSSYLKNRNGKLASRSTNDEAGDMNTTFPYEDNVAIGANQAGGNPYYSLEGKEQGIYNGGRY